MTDTKFLDLDGLAPAAKFSIRLNGKTHEMKEMTVEDFVWATKEADSRVEAAGENMGAVAEAMVDVLHRQFPTVERKEFMALDLDKLSALLKFTRDLAEDGAEETVARAVSEGKAEVEMTEEAPQS